MTRLLAALLSLLLTAYPAAAAVVTITVVDGGGVSRTFNVTTPTSITGALSWNNVICDQAAGAICATVTAGNALKVDGSAVTQPVSQGTASNLNAQVVGNVAAGGALAGNPVRIGLTDNTLVQNWFTAITLGDGVNGNNTAAVAGWVWNGTTWDRMPGSTAGVKAVVTQPTGTNLHAVIDTGSTTAVTQATGTNLHAVIDTGSTTAVTQVTSSNLKAQVDPLTAASWGIATSTQNSTVATNGQLALAQFNTSPTTITTGNMSPLQLDASGNLKVNIITGAATGSTFGAAFPATGTAIGMTQGGNMVALSGTAGNLNVQCANCSGSGVSTADQAAFVQGTSLFAGAGGVFLDTATVSSGFQGMFRMTTKRAQIIDTDITGNALYTALTAPAKIDQTTPGTTNGVFVTNATSLGRAAAAASNPVVPVAAASTAGAIVPNNTNSVVVKGSAGTLFGVQIYGLGSAPAYLKIYNAATATCGSGTPVKRLMIPAAATAANGAGSNVTFGPGLAFGTGITYCVTTGLPDNDTGTPAATTFLVNMDFE
jgi:hypothetical protein